MCNTGSGAQWSQQQKLIAVEIMQYNQGINLENLDLTLGNRFFGRSVVINTQYEVAVGVSSLDHGSKYHFDFILFLFLLVNSLDYHSNLTLHYLF